MHRTKPVWAANTPDWRQGCRRSITDPHPLEYATYGYRRVNYRVLPEPRKYIKVQGTRLLCFKRDLVYWRNKWSKYE